jgi:lysosomal acid lipase/cholesteryl ester hydrolase
MQNRFVNPSDDAFWAYSWDDFALIDLPTQVTPLFSHTGRMAVKLIASLQLNYVLDWTGVSTLSYMGHSQGTIQAFAGFIRNHTLASQVRISQSTADKLTLRQVNVFIALAPVAYVTHVESVILQAMVHRCDCCRRRTDFKR